MTLRGTRELCFALAPTLVQSPPPEAVVPPGGYTSAVEALSLWRLDYEDRELAKLLGAPPLVAKVNLLDSLTGECQVLLDAVLLPDVRYILSTQAYGWTYYAYVNGPRRVQRRDPETDALLYGDIDAPLVRSDGRGGDYTRAGNADFTVAGGIATIEKLIWHRLFTPQGSLDWAPRYGSTLSLKTLAPRDLRSFEARMRTQVEDVPGVVRASVTVLFEQDHAMVRVRAQTDFGELVSERRPS